MTVNKDCPEIIKRQEGMAKEYQIQQLDKERQSARTLQQEEDGILRSEVVNKQTLRKKAEDLPFSKTGTKGRVEKKCQSTGGKLRGSTGRQNPREVGDDDAPNPWKARSKNTR